MVFYNFISFLTIFSQGCPVQQAGLNGALNLILCFNLTCMTCIDKPWGWNFGLWFDIIYVYRPAFKTSHDPETLYVAKNKTWCGKWTVWKGTISLCFLVISACMHFFFRWSLCPGVIAVLYAANWQEKISDPDKKLLRSFCLFSL